MLYITKNGKKFKSRDGVLTYLKPDGSVRMYLHKHKLGCMNFINLDSFENHIDSIVGNVLGYYTEVKNEDKFSL